MDLVGWIEEYEQWEAGAVAHRFLCWTVFDGELGFVGDENGPWAIMHVQDGAVTPLLLGTPEALWERRPQTWPGRAHVPVPAVVFGGGRWTFTPVWGRTLLGVARCPGGRAVALGIVGETVGMAVLGPEPVLVFVGRPQEIGTVSLDHLDWLTKPARVAKSAKTTTGSTTSPPPAAAPKARVVQATSLKIAQHFDRVRAAVPNASHSRRWSAAAIAEIPQVIDALERWARDGRGSFGGRKQRVHAALAASSDFRASVDGVGAALAALAQVCPDVVTPASPRTWHIHMDPDLFWGSDPEPLPCRPTIERATERPRGSQAEEEGGPSLAAGTGRASVGAVVEVKVEVDVFSLFRVGR